MDKPLHVLLVDDDPDILRIVASKLSHAGYEVLSAHDGAEGRETARRLQPDLILLDIHMPILDGYKTLENMKRDKETRAIPVIFLTNEDLSIEAQKIWKEIGVEDYIPKSAETEVMLSTIARVMKLHGHTIPAPLPE